MQEILKKATPHLLAIIAFTVIISVYMSPQFQGKQISASDNIQWRGMAEETREYREREGRQILWTNAMFIGMPTNFVSLSHPNLLTFYSDVAKLFFSRPISFFLAFFICAYILFVCLKIPPFLSFIGGSMIALTTNNFILVEAGHNTKAEVLVYTSLIIAGFLLAVRKKYIWGGLIFAIGLSLSIYFEHIQMTYYLALCMIIGSVAYLIDFIKKKDYKHILLIAGVLGAASLLAVSTNMSSLWTSYELSQETMRGQPVLSEVSAREAASSSETDGLAWDYAMAWSNGWMDNFALLIPGIVGGSSGERVGPGTESYETLRQGGAPPQAGNYYSLPLYWGSLPFTSGPIYAGAIVCFLFVLSFFILKGPIRWWFGLSVLLTVLLAMGKNFEFLSALFFDHFPLYNKFRTPNSILSVTVLLMPIPGILALREIIKGNVEQEVFKKGLMYSAGITGGICLFFALLGPSMFSFVGANDQQIQQSGIYDLIIQERQWWMRSDAWRSFLLITLAAALIWLYYNSRIKENVLMLSLAFLVLADFISVNLRYLHPNDFQAVEHVEGLFAKRDVDRQILDNEPHRGAYRVFDLSINTFNSSSTSFHHNTIGGYHAAKLQRIQDLIDHHISVNNEEVLNMLNTKYIINQQEQLSVNPDALGNVWLVSDIMIVNSPREEIDALNSFNPQTTAVVLDSEFDNYIGDFSPNGMGSIEMTNYIPDHWTYEFSSDSEQFAVFSEAWFGAGEGLRAYLNGERVPFVRANYALRGLRLPPGDHTVEFRFLPRSYTVGSQFTRYSSFLLLWGFLGWIGWSLYSNRQNLMAPPPPKEEKKPRVKVARKASKRKRKKR